MMRFKEYLVEELSGDKSINLNQFKVKLFSKLSSVLDISDVEVYIEMINLVQSIKQLVIDSNDGEDVEKDFKSDVKIIVKHLFPVSNNVEVLGVLNSEVVNKLGDISSIDLLDNSMNSGDVFGKLIYSIFSKNIKPELEQSDLGLVKKWVNNYKNVGDSLAAKSRNRKLLKDKLLDKITVEKIG